MILSAESPLLVGILVNHDPAAKQYAEWTGKACRKDGLRYELRVVDDPLDVEAVLVDANDDPKVHGIIVYYPIFGTGDNKTMTTFSGVSHDDYLRDTVSIKCDVEGLCHTYRTNLYRNVRFMDYPTNTQKCVLPCTALAVAKILEHCPGVYDATQPVGRKMQGMIVTVINRSEIVGRPLAAMLANDGATVYSIDLDSIYCLSSTTSSSTTARAERRQAYQQQRLYSCTGIETPESCVRQSHVVITGVPTRSYQLPTEWIRPNTTVINVASFPNVREEELLQIPGVVYVPQVGKVTVAMLERNLMRLFENYHIPSRRYSQLPIADDEGTRKSLPWYGNSIQLYTAAIVTALLALQLSSRKLT
jgi:methylenetetrahydrofolate dehydrogenase (NAD+)